MCGVSQCGHHTESLKKLSFSIVVVSAMIPVQTGRVVSGQLYVNVPCSNHIANNTELARLVRGSMRLNPSTTEATRVVFHTIHRAAPLDSQGSAAWAAVGPRVTSRPPHAGRAEAIGLRMMPTFPRPSYHSVRQGFPRYGWKVGM
jgi:hypothetical protein